MSDLIDRLNARADEAGHPKSELYREASARIAWLESIFQFEDDEAVKTAPNDPVTADAVVMKRSLFDDDIHRHFALEVKCHDMERLIIRLHTDEVLSEGQVAKVTGLDRVEIRKRVDELNEDRTNG